MKREKFLEEMKRVIEITLDILEKFKMITPQEKFILVEYFIREKSLDEISKSFRRLSKERIRQIRDKGILKLKMFDTKKADYLINCMVREKLESIEKLLKEMLPIIKGDALENVILDSVTVAKLKSAGIFSVRQLKELSNEQLLRVRGLGMKHIREIKEKLKVLENY
jgi:DNA-directed RNA polymerase alpha subunit